MNERCGFCGRYLKQSWRLTNDEPDGWEDSWHCSQDTKHKLEHPEAFGLQVEKAGVGASDGR